MAISILDDKSIIPDDGQVKDVLGKTFQLWSAIKKYFEDKQRDVQEEWKFYSQKSGWSAKLIHKKRTILYLIPGKGYFMAAFVFGDKAVAAAEQSTLPESILDMIRSARKYVEGRGFRFEVRGQEDVENVKKLIEIKMAN
jgi:hypothetical protein